MPHCAPSIKPEGRAAVWATSLVAREYPLCCHFPLKMLILIITKRVFYRQGTGVSAPSAAYDATARCDVLSAEHTFLLPWNLIDESRQPDGKCRGRTLSVGTPIAAHSTSRRHRVVGSVPQVLLLVREKVSVVQTVQDRSTGRQCAPQQTKFATGTQSGHVLQHPIVQSSLAKPIHEDRMFETPQLHLRLRRANRLSVWM